MLPHATCESCSQQVIGIVTGIAIGGVIIILLFLYIGWGVMLVVCKILIFENLGGRNSADPAKRFSRPRRKFPYPPDLLIRPKTSFLTILKIMKILKMLVVFLLLY